MILYFPRRTHLAGITGMAIGALIQSLIIRSLRRNSIRTSIRTCLLMLAAIKNVRQIQINFKWPPANDFEDEIFVPTPSSKSHLLRKMPWAKNSWKPCQFSPCIRTKHQIPASALKSCLDASYIPSVVPAAKKRHFQTASISIHAMLVCTPPFSRNRGRRRRRTCVNNQIC